jgi:hypothetical protein
MLVNVKRYKKLLITSHKTRSRQLIQLFMLPLSILPFHLHLLPFKTAFIELNAFMILNLDIFLSRYFLWHLEVFQAISHLAPVISAKQETFCHPIQMCDAVHYKQFQLSYRCLLRSH